MLYQELPRIESTRLDGWNRWLAPGVIVGVAFTVALLLLLIGQAYFAAAAMLIGVAGAATVHLRTPREAAPGEPLVVGPDYSLVGGSAGGGGRRQGQAARRESAISPAGTGIERQTRVGSLQRSGRARRKSAVALHQRRRSCDSVARRACARGGG